MYGCIAAGRPIVFVGPASSDVHLLCREAGLPYERIDAGDIAGFATALDRLAWLDEGSKIAVARPGEGLGVLAIRPLSE